MLGFRSALHKLTGVKLKMSSMYHPQTDGASKRTNKTVNQALCYHIAQNQKGWAQALPHVHFDLMNTVNKSTGFSPFQLHLGQSPCLITLLCTPIAPTPLEEVWAWELIKKLQQDAFKAQDNLLKAKVTQATYANLTHNTNLDLNIGDQVMLSTKNRWQQYAAKGEKRVMKFMPQFDGPYSIADMNHGASMVTLHLIQCVSDISHLWSGTIQWEWPFTISHLWIHMTRSNHHWRWCTRILCQEDNWCA